MIQKFKHLSKIDAEVCMKEWIDSGHKIQSLDKDYIAVRNSLTASYQDTLSEVKSQDRRDYLIDIKYGMKLYDYLRSQTWFTLREASCDDFWRFLSVIILPDIVSERWGETNANHIWKQSNRIWLKNLWWYIHLSFQENSEVTLKMLSATSFNTDTILNLVERTGKKGTYVEVYRKIMHFYSLIPKSEIERFSRRTSKQDTVFRALMRLNTVRLLIFDPLLMEGGSESYVKKLIADLNLSTENYGKDNY